MARPLAEALAEAIARYDMSSLFVIGSAGAMFSEPSKNELQRQAAEHDGVDSFGVTESGHQGSVTRRAARRPTAARASS